MSRVGGSPPCLQRLPQMLAADVVAYADGGGEAHASTEPSVGIEDVMELHASLARLFAENTSRLVRYGFVNGLPGFVSIEEDKILQTTALEIEHDTSRSMSHGIRTNYAICVAKSFNEPIG